jgi:murein DD-endopeptidase MepM/ murein hydrolase activator NlpD
MRRALLAATALLVAPGLLGGATARGKPALKIKATTRQPRQGDVVGFTAESDRPLASLTLVDEERHLGMERREGGTVFRGLLGFDFEGAAGPRTLEFAAMDEAGSGGATPYAVRVRPGRFPVQKLSVDPRFVEVPEAERERVKAEQERVAAVWQKPDPARRFPGPFRFPVEARSQENFGARRVYNGESHSRHAGLDLSAPEGTPVLAPAPARVALTGDLYFSGGTVILDHGEGLFTMYFHLSRVDVKEGEIVDAGQPLGLVGHTGRATGPHLHWAARLNGARVDPRGLLKLAPWPLPGAP